MSKAAIVILGMVAIAAAIVYWIYAKGITTKTNFVNVLTPPAPPLPPIDGDAKNLVTPPSALTNQPPAKVPIAIGISSLVDHGDVTDNDGANISILPRGLERVPGMPMWECAEDLALDEAAIGYYMQFPDPCATARRDRETATQFAVSPRGEAVQGEIIDMSEMQAGDYFINPVSGTKVIYNGVNIAGEQIWTSMAYGGASTEKASATSDPAAYLGRPAANPDYTFTNSFTQFIKDKALFIRRGAF